MLLFFTEISRTAAITLIVLAALSVVIRNFWCRYLCPYGALLGLVSWASPQRVVRDGSCTDCKACTAPAGGNHRAQKNPSGPRSAPGACRALPPARSRTA
jgi:polyferredoxin